MEQLPSFLNHKDTDPCYRVSELTEKIRSELESTFPPLWIKGEVSNFTAHSSGHWYFTLKDSKSQVRAVMFRAHNQTVKKFLPSGGMEVKVYGKISVYKARGEYQIICQYIEECGKGALKEEFERIKNKLKKEGLFSGPKKPLPLLPKLIAVISSPTGAAIRDVIKILKNLCPSVEVLLIPAIVQGESAEESLVQAIEKAQQIQNLDVLIITRGGGSLEDLWAFNSEKLARSLFAFDRPVVSAVGHEIDFSICDFVADHRASTPTAAGELVVRDANDQIHKISKLQKNLSQSMRQKILILQHQIQRLTQTLISPQKKLQDWIQHLDELTLRLKKEIQRQVYLKNQKAQSLKSLLQSLSPLRVLNRGYILVQKKNQYIKNAKNLKIGDDIKIQFASGSVFAHVTRVDLSDKKGGDYEF